MIPPHDATDSIDTLNHPPAPRTIAESGLSIGLVTDMTLKRLYLASELTGSELAMRLGVPFSVVQPALDRLKSQRYCEIAGGTMAGEASYVYRITTGGRDRADAALRANHYTGVLPVPLDQYRAYMRQFQDRTRTTINRDMVRDAFKHLVISDHVLDQLGPAINAGHSMFVYGPPGNGKTVIARGVSNLLPGAIAIPHAVEVDGAIIRWFDPVKHELVPGTGANNTLDAGPQHDQRWAVCRRPSVMVGGELTLKSLDLSYDPTVGYHQAPVQAIANGGLLIVDDFGRQQCSPRELLNRWVVPLESRIDFLTLQSGHTFGFPFQVLVVFATNIPPEDLVDEAFLRRIHYKVRAESPTLEEFLQIFEDCCRAREIAFERPLVDELLSAYYRPRDIQPRGCQPRDLIDHALSLADYLGEPRRLTLKLLEAACAGYFVDAPAG